MARHVQAGQQTNRVQKSKPAKPTATSKKIALKKTVPEGNIGNALRSFQFFGLPSEVQNNIYELWAADVDTIYVKPYGKGYVTSNHPVRLLSPRIYRDFNGMLSQVAPVAATVTVINAEVVDFDFRPLMTFLNRIIGRADTGLAGPDLENSGSNRTIHIFFSVTSAWCKNPDVDKMMRWFKWNSGVAKKDYEFDFVYGIKDIEDDALVKKTFHNFKSGNAKNLKWMDIVQTFEDWFRDGGEDKNVARERHIKALQEEARLAGDAMNRFAFYMPDFD